MNKKLILYVVIAAAILLVIYLNRKGYLNMIKPKRLLKYFELKEFDTTATPSQLGSSNIYVDKYGKNKVRYSGEKNMDKDFLFKIDRARDIIEKGWNKLNPSNKIYFAISSGYRSPEYNSTLNTVSNSAHTFGKAADIAWSSYNEAQKEVILEALYEVGFRRFGIHPTFVHVDNADENTGHPTPAVWTYNKPNPIVSNIEQIASLSS